MVDRNPRLMLPVILAGYFMYGFDGNVVNVAIPALQRDLRAGPGALELVVGGYVFAYATGLVTGGRLGDLFGHRRPFLIGMAGFVAASVLCGLARTPGELVGARLVQGFAAAVMVPQVLALITATFPAATRSRALTWFAVTGGISGICGQVLGGLLLVADVFGLGWRAIFFVNVPVGAVVLAAAALLLPRTEPGRRAGLDPLGVAGISGSLALALAPLVLGRETGRPLWTWVSLAASVPVMAAALAWERRLARSGGRPLLELDLFRDRAFTAGLAINAAFMAFFFGFIFVTSLLLQAGLGLSALRAGLAFAPMAVLAMAAALTGRRLAARHGLRVLAAGCAITALSVFAMAVDLRVEGGQVTAATLMVCLGLMGLGNGLILPALIGAPLAGVRPAEAGAAAGMLSTAQQFAGVTGVAVLGTVFFSRLGGAHDRAGYAAAAEAATWITLGITLAMTALVPVLRRAPQVVQPVLERR